MTNHALMSETSAIGWLANSHYFKLSVPLEVRHTLSFTGGPLVVSNTNVQKCGRYCQWALKRGFGPVVAA